MARKTPRYRKIYTCMYGDEKYRRLSAPQPCGQVLWWHLLAGEQTGPIPGVFRIGEAAFAEQLGWPLEAFRLAFAEAFREGMVRCDWNARFVWVPNAIRYNPPESINVVKSWADAWRELPECSLKVEVWQHFRAFLEAIGQAFAHAFTKACRKPCGNQEQEQEQDLPSSSSTSKKEKGDARGKNTAAWDRAAREVSPSAPSETLCEVLKLAYVAVAQNALPALREAQEAARHRAKGNKMDYLKGVFARKLGIEKSALFRELDALQVPPQYLKPKAAAKPALQKEM